MNFYTLWLGAPASQMVQKPSIDRICTWAFYKYIEDELLPFKLHGVYVVFWAFTVFPMRWEHMGSMFGGGEALKQNVVLEQTQKEEVAAKPIDVGI